VHDCRQLEWQDEHRPAHPDHPNDASVLVQRTLDLGMRPVSKAYTGRQEHRRRVGGMQPDQAAGQLGEVIRCRATQEVPSPESGASLLNRNPAQGHAST
jgi:hypothetical protein